MYLNQKTVNAFCLYNAREIYVRPNDIAQFEDLSDSKPSLVRDLLDNLSLGHTDDRSSLSFRAELCILKLDAGFPD